MTEREILQWIKKNLSAIIAQAIADSKTDLFTDDLMAAMAMREVNNKILKYAAKPFAEVCEQMKGDWSQRPGESKPTYHGFSFWQIDTASYPDFISTGAWKDPYKSCMKAISVLESKRKYLVSKLGDVPLNAIVAAYNCGEGNVYKAIKKGISVDTYTHNHDYSKEVFRYKDIYNSLP